MKESPRADLQRLPDKRLRSEVGRQSNRGLEFDLRTGRTRLDLGQAKRDLSAANSIANIDERSKACSDIIRDLCAGGLSNEAWELVEQMLPGQVRDVMLATFFESSQLDRLELQKKILELDDKLDIWVALGAYLSRFEIGTLSRVLKEDDFSSFYSQIVAKVKNANLSNILSGILQEQMTISGANRQRQLIEMGREMLVAGYITSEGISSVLEKDTVSNAFEKWSIILEIESSKLDVESNIKNKAIGNMIKSDAPRALEQLMKDSGDKMIINVQKGVHEWTLLDSQGAFDWYAKNSSSISPEQRTAIISGFFKAAVDFKDYDVAHQWASQIPDQKLRDAALKVIEARNSAMKSD